MGRSAASAREEDRPYQRGPSVAQGEEIQTDLSQDHQVLLLLALLRRYAQEAGARKVVRGRRENSEDKRALSVLLFAVSLRVLLPFWAALFQQLIKTPNTYQVPQKVWGKTYLEDIEDKENFCMEKKMELGRTYKRTVLENSQEYGNKNFLLNNEENISEGLIEQ